MTDTQHTETPYTHVDAGATIVDNTGHIVAKLPPQNGRMAKAVFIVKACNNHDALVEALTEIKARLSGLALNLEATIIYNIAEQALKQAEGKGE